MTPSLRCSPLAHFKSDVPGAHCPSLGVDQNDLLTGHYRPTGHIGAATPPQVFERRFLRMGRAARALFTRASGAREPGSLPETSELISLSVRTMKVCEEPLSIGPKGSADRITPSNGAPVADLSITWGMMEGRSLPHPPFPARASLATKVTANVASSNRHIWPTTNLRIIFSFPKLYCPKDKSFHSGGERPATAPAERSGAISWNADLLDQFFKQRHGFMDRVATEELLTAIRRCDRTVPARTGATWRRPPAGCRPFRIS